MIRSPPTRSSSERARAFLSSSVSLSGMSCVNELALLLGVAMTVFCCWIVVCGVLSAPLSSSGEFSLRNLPVVPQHRPAYAVPHLPRSAAQNQTGQGCSCWVIATLAPLLLGSSVNSPSQTFGGTRVGGHRAWCAGRLLWRSSLSSWCVIGS